MLVLQVDEEHVDEPSVFLLVPTPALFLLQLEGQSLYDVGGTWRWVELGWTWLLR